MFEGNSRQTVLMRLLITLPPMKWQNSLYALIVQFHRNIIDIKWMENSRKSSIVVNWKKLRLVSMDRREILGEVEGQ